MGNCEQVTVMSHGWVYLLMIMLSPH